MYLSVKKLLVALLSLCAVFHAISIQAQQTQAASTYQNDNIRVSLLSKSTHVLPGQTLEMALRLQPDEGWHTYWRNPGDTGLPTRIEWTLPQGFRAGEIEWPVPEWIDYQGLTNFGFHGDTWLLIPVAVPYDLSQFVETGVELNATAKWLVCKDVCIPGQASLQISLPVARQSSKVSYHSHWQSDFDNARKRLPELLDDVSAEYNVDGHFELHINIESLPTFNQQPNVFLASKGLVANKTPPEVKIGTDKLIVTAVRDAYFEEAPAFLPLVVSQSEESDKAIALEVIARHNPKLAMTNIVASSMGDAQEKNISLLYILLFAMLGGLILNAMPCVFPVLSLKIISLVDHGNHSAQERRGHGLAYSAGVISSFLLIAAVLMILRAFGEQIGWGFQLQSPWFVALLIYVLFILGLSLSGVIEIGSTLQNLGSGLTQNTNHASGGRLKGSFFTGVLATVVATPCTAPFMGTAMGFALGQAPLVALLVFSVMGLGLALPFLLIAYVPVLANALPQPGNWMLRLKEVMAFPMYLTVVWLLWVFARQQGSDATAVLLIGLVLLAFAAWLWRITLYRDRIWLARSSSLAIGGIALAMIVVSLSLGRVPASEPGQTANGEQIYSPASLKQALADNKTVFVNMTADWCITCKVNERVTLKTDGIQAAFKEQGVVYLKGDWTNSDAGITTYLEQFDRNGVPLYVVYKPGNEPKVLPQILTPDIVLESIQ